MNREFKGISNKISINGDEIFIKWIFIKETFNIKNIKSISIKKPCGNGNGEIDIVTQKNSFQLSYKANQFEYDELYDYLCDRMAFLTGKDVSNVQNNIIQKINGLNYCGGHPLMPDERKVAIEIMDRSIVIHYLFSANNSIEYSDIQNIRIETQEQLDSRFTATRLALLGPFALAFKKKKVTKEKYLTIDFLDANKTELTVVFSGQLVPSVYSIIYKVFSDYKSNHITQSDDNGNIENNSSDPYEEVKKLKELLDMGILSQEEFDKKKTELLGL